MGITGDANAREMIGPKCPGRAAPAWGGLSSFYGSTFWKLCPPRLPGPAVARPRGRVTRGRDAADDAADDDAQGREDAARARRGEDQPPAPSYHIISYHFLIGSCIIIGGGGGSSSYQLRPIGSILSAAPSALLRMRRMPTAGTAPAPAQAGRRAAWLRQPPWPANRSLRPVAHVARWLASLARARRGSRPPRSLHGRCARIGGFMMGAPRSGSQASPPHAARRQRW
eukprot:scaffold508_cov554-Prasinococcus_capsulatus_cf.AAC.14